MAEKYFIASLLVFLLPAVPFGAAGRDCGYIVYGSNRGHDSIAVFSVQGRKGILKPVEHVSTRGKTPRHFAIDPTGEYLFAANQNSGEVVLFRIHRKTGELSFTGTVLKIPAPVCVVFVPLPY